MAPIAQVNIRIVDEKDQSATVLFYTDLARFNGLFNGQFLDMEEYFQEVARRLDALITGRIEALSATILMTLPAGIKAAPLLGSDVEERARWVWPSAVQGVAFDHTIPTFDHDAFFTGGVTVIDSVTNADISYYATLLYLATDALDWAAEYGGINEQRGGNLNQPPTIHKTFRPR